MATRFYFPSSGTPPLTTLAQSSTWGLPAGDDPHVARLPTFTTKQDTALTTSNFTWPSTATDTCCFWQYQSEPLASPHTFTSSDTIQFIIGKCLEGTSGTDTNVTIRVKVVSNDGTVERGILRTATGTSEFSAITASTRLINTAVIGETIANIGDRIIIEIGVTGTTPETQQVDMRVGDPTAVADFAFTSSLTTDLCSWIELSPTLTFADLDVQLIGDGSQRKQEGSGTLTFATGIDVELVGDGTQRKQIGSGTITLPDVFLYGTGTQRRQSGDGTLNFTDVDVRLIGHGTQRRAIGFGGLSLDDSILIYGSGIQRRQSGIGTLFSPISGETSALLDAGIRFVLTIDGEIYPLIGAVIQRHRNYEKASVTIPGAITWAILATVPTNLEIYLSRRRIDGSSIETINMFTGVIDLSLASLNGLTGELVANGSAIYPTRENRRLSGSPSYIRDSGDQVAVRGQINPYLVPGDVLRFSDVRELAVSKVVFNINPNLMFMEASSGI